MSNLQRFIQENRTERERLLALMAGMKEADYHRTLPNGWTVGVALVHLAFWDLSQVARMKSWKDQGVKPASLDPEAINGPLAALSEAIHPKAVVKLATEAAEAADRMVESLTPAQAEELVKMGLERNLQRYGHRRLHLDKIEEALKG